MRSGRARRQKARNLCRRGHLKRNISIQVGGNTDVTDHQFTHSSCARKEDVSPLGSSQCDGQIGRQDRRVKGAIVAIEPGRHVESHDNG